jgi:hypothetical protein
VHFLFFFKEEYMSEEFSKAGRDNNIAEVRRLLDLGEDPNTVDRVRCLHFIPMLLMAFSESIKLYRIENRETT